MAQKDLPKVGWGTVVLGEAIDLEDWAHVLKKPFDPWVEIHGGDTVLRSTSFDELQSASEVRDRAMAYIDRLNGAMALSQNSRPVQLAGAIRFAPDGAMHKTVFLEPLLFENPRPVFGRPTMTTIGPDGQPIPPPQPPAPQPSEVQRWARVADNEYWLNDALIYFGRATDWFDIYKTLECLIGKFGAGNEKNFLALNWADEDEIKRLKRTANWVARHARRKFKRPPKPMELPQARRLVGQLLRRALEETAGPRQ